MPDRLWLLALPLIGAVCAALGAAVGIAAVLAWV